MSTEVSVSKIFEVMQAMSGQGNCITIPVPYIEFFAGDQQAHLLAAILNQLVFWSSGKSHLDNGWFYKGHKELAIELHGVSVNTVRKAMQKIVHHYLPDAIEEDLRKAGGTPKKHYRINEEKLIAKVFPHLSDSAEVPNGNGENAESADSLDSAETPNGNGESAELNRQKCRMETAETPNPGIGRSAEFILYTDLKNRSLHTDHKNRPGEISPVDNFLSRHPDAVIFDAEKSLWGNADDLAFAEWFFARRVELHERAAEFDGMISRPDEPNWTVWANEIRLLREGQGCNHDQMRTMVERVHNSVFWCKYVKTASSLREKWPDLVVQLCPVSLASQSDPFGSSFKVDTRIPKGFKGAV
ncbi:phage O protein family [Trabulsiella odontotermitis]|uniref:Phage O protein family n=2 Tax=Trabulsiella odontotermitis TaxID=379893 RepID=A0A0L0GY63_9ENTR|nr:phage O protein family [Trabulsiella odontotermitis]